MSAYSASGVNYHQLDPAKIIFQNAAAATERLTRIEDLTTPLPWTRGESCFLHRIDGSTLHLAHVHETLGTKNLVADAMELLTGRNYYHGIGQDGVAMVVNDMITLGALPISVAMHLSAGSSAWFKDLDRVTNLAQGWAQACVFAGATWAGGETPALTDILMPDVCELSGSALGVVHQDHIMNPLHLEQGDEMVFLSNPGLGANGFTLAREISYLLDEGYLTKIDNDGTTYGEALLTPTPIYVSALRSLQRNGLKPVYGVNVTGHGMLKLMRAPQSFTYRVTALPVKKPAVFECIQDARKISNEEMYSTYNMGIGFVFFMKNGEADTAVDLLANAGFGAWRGGYVGRAGTKQVILEQLGVVYKGAQLSIR